MRVRTSPILLPLSRGRGRSGAPMDHEAKLLNAAQRVPLHGNAVNLRFACYSVQSKFEWLFKWGLEIPILHTSAFSGGALKCGTIVSHKLLNTFGGELMSDIEVLPQKIKIQLFVWNRFQGLAIGTNGFVGEVLIGHRKVAGSPLFYNLCWNSHELTS